MSTRRARTLASELALAAALAGCGDAAGGTDGASSTGGSSGIDPSAPPATSGTSDELPTTGADATGTDSGGGPPPVTYCGQLDVSLVFHPGAKLYGAAEREALTGLLDDLAEQTGAKVRVLPNAGTEFMLQTDCLLAMGNAAGDPILVWGEEGATRAGAHEALGCTLDALDAYVSDFDAGNFLFSGLMFPVLERDDWPAPGATGLAVLAAVTDDHQDNMYAQPGMAAEAYLRIVGEGDRRRVAALTWGDGAGELEIFGLALSDKSRHFETEDASFAEALAAFAPVAVQACDEFDLEPPLPEVEPSGCKKIDVLFAIDGSGSMDGEQDALRGANGEPGVFADFTDALLAELTEVEDFHVGVVSSEEEVTLLHTHRDFPATPEGPETDCGLPPGQRWLVGPSDTLAEDFACIAATRSGTDEVTAYNAAEALHDPDNAGFLRDDSLVFVVMLTDEDTYDFIYAKMVEIRARFLAAVGGDLSRLVVLTIAGGQGVFEMPETTCTGVYGKAAPGRRLISITYSFRERGLFQNICQGDLAATFTEVLDDVVSACEAFEPVP